MHDDFLYQLRRAPSPTFARRLKAKLDRASHEPWRGFRIGMLLFLCGAAFALVLADGATHDSRLPLISAIDQHAEASCDRGAADCAGGSRDRNEFERPPGCTREPSRQLPSRCHER